MSVKIISITKPLGDLQDLSPEDLIVYIARVSNPSNQLNTETSKKLIEYCLKNNHWSIFEQVNMTVEITTSRAIAAQILRHRTFTFQEYSQRYAKAADQIIYPARRQDIKNRQNSVDDLPDEIKDWFTKAQNGINHQANELYQEALNKGIAKEQARFLLPLSTETRLYMTGSIRSWIHYCTVRCEKSTQLEHREIANNIFLILKHNFPNISNILEEKHSYLREISND